MDDSVPDSYTPMPSASPVSNGSPASDSGDLPSDASPISPSAGAVAKKIPLGPAHAKAVFASKDLTLDLRYVSTTELECVNPPVVSLKTLDLKEKGHKGTGVYADIVMEEGQVVTFVLRSPPVKAASGIGQPTRLQADRLGVAFEGEWLVRGGGGEADFVGWIDLVKGASKLRSRDDPILTPVSLLFLFFCFALT